MKNIFKLMGIALLAGTMFVACSDDDDDNAITVNFNGTSWSTDETMSVIPMGTDMIEVDIYHNDEEALEIRCGASEETYTMSDDPDYYIYFWDESGVPYEQFKPESMIEITDLDFDQLTGTVSADLNAEVSHNGNDYYTLTAKVRDANFTVEASK